MSRKRRHGVSRRRSSTASRSAGGVGFSCASAADAIEGSGSAPDAGQSSRVIRSVDLALLDEAKRRAGLLSRTEAFRLVLREWARASNVEIEGKTSRRRPRPKK
jgi:hypothetical protein